MKHILLQKAFNSKKRKEIKEPEGYFFDNILGAWKSEVDNTLLINSANYPARGTKKRRHRNGRRPQGAVALIPKKNNETHFTTKGFQLQKKEECSSTSRIFL